MKLRTRLVLSFALIIVLCLSVVAISLVVLVQDYLDDLAIARLGDMAFPAYIQVRAIAMGRTSLDQAWGNLEEQAKESGVGFFLIDNQGEVLKQALPLGATWEQPTKAQLNMPPYPRPLPQRGGYVSSKGETFLYIAYSLGVPRARVPNAPDVLVLAMPRSHALAFWTGLAPPFLWAGLIAFAVSIVIAIFLARSVYVPIRRVADATEDVALGQYDREVPVDGPEEVKGLALRFNQMAKQVKRSQQTLRDFVADASHELRSPLTSIRGFAQAIRDGTARDADAQLKAASVIDDESRRMMRLVEDLLDLSRLQSGQVKMVREELDLNELLQQCREIFALQSEGRGVQLVVDSGPLSPIIGDADRLDQVFGNLVDNALKHTLSGGKITIIARQPSPDSIMVNVTDTGPGIPPEQLAHIFERFYRADLSAGKSGTGLGLAIAREIVRAHGGDITVSSVVDQGTEFQVKLPVISAFSSLETDRPKGPC